MSYFGTNNYDRKYKKDTTQPKYPCNNLGTGKAPKQQQKSK